MSGGEVLKYVQERLPGQNMWRLSVLTAPLGNATLSLLRQAAGNRLSEAQLRHLTKKCPPKTSFSTHASGVVISSEPIVYYQAVRSEQGDGSNARGYARP